MPVLSPPMPSAPASPTSLPAPIFLRHQASLLPCTCDNAVPSTDKYTTAGFSAPLFQQRSPESEYGHTVHVEGIVLPIESADSAAFSLPTTVTDTVDNAVSTPASATHDLQRSPAVAAAPSLGPSLVALPVELVPSSRQTSTSADELVYWPSVPRPRPPPGFSIFIEPPPTYTLRVTNCPRCCMHDLLHPASFFLPSVVTRRPRICVPHR